MSLSSFDGLLPSTFKKLLAGELPQHRSSHLSEAMAAGCGYPNHAAMLADLRESVPVTFLAVPRLDSDAMGYRLAKIIGATTPDATDAIVDDVHRALVHIHAHVVGDIVPVGNRSKLMPDPSKMSPAALARREGRSASIMQQAARKKGDEHALMDAALLDALRRHLEPGAIWSTWTMRLLERLVPACRLICGDDPFVSDIMQAASFDSIRELVDDDRLPLRMRHSLNRYLAGIPLYDRTVVGQSSTVRQQHGIIVGMVIHAVSCLLLSGEDISGWGSLRPIASPIPTRDQRLVRASKKGLADAIIGSLPRSGHGFQKLEDASWLVSNVIDSLDEVGRLESMTSFDLRLSFCLPRLIETADGAVGPGAAGIAGHVRILEHAHGNDPSRMLEAHAPTESLIAQALQHEDVIRLWSGN